MATDVFSSGSGPWVWPDGVTSVTVEVMGGGGAGGAATGTTSTAGGGKGGGYGRCVITKGAESMLDYWVGGGGVSGGTNGISSWVKQGAVVRANGPGGRNAVAATGTTSAGATLTTAGDVPVGDVAFAGGDGGTPASTTISGAGGGAAGPAGAGGTASVGVAGVAGSGVFLDGVAYQRAGAIGVVVRTAGTAAPTNGLGASGGGAGSGGNTNQTTDRAGGAGAGGIVLFTYTPVAPSMNIKTLMLAHRMRRTTS